MRKLREQQVERGLRSWPERVAVKLWAWVALRPAAYAWMDWWSRFSKTGVAGDPTVATREFGEMMFQATVERMIDLIREFKQIPIKPRQDLH